MTRQLPLVICPEDIPIVLDADLPFREKIEAVEAYFLTLEQTHSEPVHRFADGLYSRELPMPAGVFWISRVHKKENLAIILEGDATVMTECGVQRVKTGDVIITRPGTKRLIFTHKNTRWITVHATSLTETDGVEAIESELACNTLAEYEEHVNRKGVR